MDQSTNPTDLDLVSDGHSGLDSPSTLAIADAPSTPAHAATAPNRVTPGSTPLPKPDPEGWLELRLWAEMFNDAQQTRIAQTNRAKRGGVDPDIYEPYITQVELAEKVVGTQLKRCFRRVVAKPVRDWVKATKGIDEPLMARIIGHLGHPRIATPHHWEGKGNKRKLVADEPYERTVSQLLQYCGHGSPGRLRKGASFEELAAQGNPQLKMLVHLASEGIVKAGIRKDEGVAKDEPFSPWTRHSISPMGQLYLDIREETWDRTHSVECVRCGPSGKPAQPGSPWSPGHQQGDALRKIGKEILRDLWQVSAL